MLNSPVIFVAIKSAELGAVQVNPVANKSNRKALKNCLEVLMSRKIKKAFHLIYVELNAVPFFVVQLVLWALNYFW